MLCLRYPFGDYQIVPVGVFLFSVEEGGKILLGIDRAAVMYLIVVFSFQSVMASTALVSSGILDVSGK